jgi:hypothetical protein
MMLPTHKLHALVPSEYIQPYDLITYPKLLVPRFRTERFSNSFVPVAARVHNTIKVSVVIYSTFYLIT